MVVQLLDNEFAPTFFLLGLQATLFVCLFVSK